MRSGAARWLRRAEIGLSVLGASLLGGALSAVVDAHVYQARQERAFLARDRSSPGASPQASGADPLVLGRIDIPRIGVSAIVREGDDDATLAIAVGHVPGTARPGERGNIALAGHRDSFFRALRHIRVHDTIRLRTAGRGDTYVVDSTDVLPPSATGVLGPTADSVLTLVTCYPFGFLGRAPNRFVVRAHRSRDDL